MSTSTRAGNIGIGTMSIIGVCLLSACSIARFEPDPVAQQTTLSRWVRCIDTVSQNTSASSLRSIRKTARSFCDGHRRDVLATYPLHLVNQVDTLLSQRIDEMTSSHYVKTAVGKLDEATDARIERFRSRLIEARQADL